MVSRTAPNWKFVYLADTQNDEARLGFFFDCPAHPWPNFSRDGRVSRSTHVFHFKNEVYEYESIVKL